MKEFEFEIQEVDRAFKYLLNNETTGSVVVRVGSINELTINREIQLINRINEKKKISYTGFNRGM